MYLHTTHYWRFRCGSVSYGVSKWVCKITTGGVSLFFTISGFLQMYTTQKEQKHFLVKRLIRIVPLYWIMTIATFVAMLIMPGIALGEANFEEFLKSLFFIPYQRTAMKSADVVRPMVGPGWTLYYDIYFAIIFAVSMRISHKYRGVISGLMCAGLLILDGKFDQNTPFLYILAEPWWISFICGIISFYVLKYLSMNASRKSRLLQFGLLSITAICLILLYTTRLNLYKDALLSFITFICLVFAIDKNKLPKWVSILGDSSYSFYLIHYYIILIIGRVVDMTQISLTAVIGACMVITISEICAYISYQLIEKKFGNKIKTLIKI